MKKRNLLALLLSLAMLLSMLASCKGPEDTTTEVPAIESTEAKTEDTTEKQTEVTTEKPTESSSETEEVTEPAVEVDTELDGKYAEVIENANSLANQVQMVFTDGKRDSVTIENGNMSLDYVLSSNYDQQVRSLKNSNGASYIENTMDVFLKMKDGTIVYASKSQSDAVANIFRYGYYYYEARLEGQSFLNGIQSDREQKLEFNFSETRQISARVDENGVYSGKFTNNADPFLNFKNVNVVAADYNYARITMNAGSATSAMLYIAAGSKNVIDGTQTLEFELIPDGQTHTYYVYLPDIKGYTDMMTQFRIDFNGASKGDKLEVHDVSFIRGTMVGIDNIYAARVFHTYSDKLHQVVQIAVTEEVADIDSIGIVTNIPVSDVAKLIVKDASGTHDTIDGVDWNSVEYVGFDVKDAGVFGYILPDDVAAGKLEVTLEGDNYVVIQSRVPEGNKLLPGDTQSIRNKNDLYIGNRIYTDESHDFEGLMREAYIEVNPLANKNIKVSAAYSDEASYEGYDALRGAYTFTMRGTDLNSAYYRFPNRYYELNFSVKGDEYNRNIYVIAATSSGGLESAVVLDENLLLLPIPVEVSKNFGGDDASELFTLVDTAFGEAIFPLKALADDVYEYSVIHMYQNWGNFPLKQMSSIRFHAPYYHLSTGVIETNCIPPWLFPANTANKNFLPDHRAMSAPFWANQPQHTSAGRHFMLNYKDEAGKMQTHELVSQTVGSYGPTYSDITLNYLSTDGRIKVTYTHMEFPQLDENRAYYTMTYEFLDDMKLSDVKNNFYFYACNSNQTNIDYQYFGYLDKSNTPTVAKFSDVENGTVIPLGDNAPYFDLFKLDHNNYSNLGFLVKDYKIIMNGKESDTGLAIRKDAYTLYLTLDSASAAFKAGDTITINAIIMPWGSQETDYSGTVKAPDQNVRDVRDNTMINSLKASADADCAILESVYLPKIKTTNGKSAEFTLSGGQDNVAVRVYGFKDLSAIKVYTKENGEWVPYEISSANNPDELGFASHFDGYQVYYDGDGTYSYSFVTRMENGAPISFKIETDESFSSWPRINVSGVNTEPLNVYLDVLDINFEIGASSQAGQFSKIDDDGVDGLIEYISLYANPELPESKLNLYKNGDNIATGQYIVIKYRIPETTLEVFPFEFYAGTTYANAMSQDSMYVRTGIERDGEWHVLVLDTEAYGKSVANDKEEFIIRYLRFDPFNGNLEATNSIDIAYIAIHDDLAEICQLSTDIETVTVMTSDSQYYKLDTETAKKID